ncbi:hypothetical protein LEP1GSC170_0681 [Leptospira interrogans serovar Bataviae str. HAI135]|nr:hypothetical protein LEP1GSC170_0681 [Leptospira interrogans serovar Bataviae str. HAI135]
MQLAKGKNLIPNPEKTTLTEALELIHNGNKVKEINLNPINSELKKNKELPTNIIRISY